MNLLKKLVPAWVLLLGLAVFTLWARSRLPDAPIATHFNAAMQPDAWQSRDKALSVLPLVGMAVLSVLTAAPWMMPPRGALQRSARAYSAVCAGAVGFLFALQVGIVGRALHWAADITVILPIASGALFLLIGNYLGKVRYNFIFGIRTPWTLANETVWDRTHRMAGPLFMMGGAVIGVAGLYAPAQLSQVLIAGTLAPALIATVYSYWAWRRLPEADKHRVSAGA